MTLAKQRPIRLNPEGLEAYRITYPQPHSRVRKIAIEPMKFVEHDGRAKA